MGFLKSRWEEVSSEVMSKFQVWADAEIHRYFDVPVVPDLPIICVIVCNCVEVE